MVIRNIKYKQFRNLKEQLVLYAHNNPLSDQYDVNITINGTDYVLQVQVEYGNRIAALQAYEICYDDGDRGYTLINQNSFLSALLEIVIECGIRKK